MLTHGTPYRAQFLSGDTIASGGRTLKISSGAASTAFYDVAGHDDQSGRSGYVFGTFTADAATQTFTLTGDPNSRAFLNGVSIFIVPEPTQLALLAIGVPFIVRRTRRRAGVR